MDRIEWPPSGDPLFHGIYVSQILENQKIPLNISYPLGFHILSALVTLIFGIFPGESMLVVAAAITALIPCVLFSITYTKTNSMTFSLIPFLAGFIIHPNLLTGWIMGDFYNGAYPFLVGLLVMFVFVEIIFLIDETRSSAVIPSQFHFLILIILGAIFFTYQVFLIIITLYFLSTFIVHRKLIFKWMTLRTSRIIQNKTNLLILTGFGILLLISLPWIYSGPFLLLSSYLGSGSTWLTIYPVYLTFFYKQINGLIILFALIIVSITLLKFRNVEFPTNLLFLCTFIPIIIALDDSIPMNILAFLLPERIVQNLTKYMSFIIPGRTIVFLTTYSWILFARFMHLASDYTSRLLFKIEINYPKRPLKVFSTAMIYILLLYPLIPALNSHFSWSLSSNYEYNVYDLSYPYDSEAARWMALNISPQDLVLNDLSSMSLFLPSYSVNNIVFSYYTLGQYADLYQYIYPYNEANTLRAIECKAIWMDPTNFTLLNHLIVKYGISYIFSTSDRRYFDSFQTGGDDSYKDKPFNELIYAKIFDKCPFLKVRFADYATRVYEVII